MNRIYKVIYSKARQCYIVVSELAKSNHKSSQQGADHTNTPALARIIAVALAAGALTWGSVPEVSWAADNTTVTDSNGIQSRIQIRRLKILMQILPARRIRSQTVAMQRLSVMVIRLLMKQKAKMVALDMSEATMRVFMARETPFLPAVISRSLVTITRLWAEMMERSQIISIRKDENQMYQI